MELFTGRADLRCLRGGSASRPSLPFISHWMQLENDFRITLHLGIQARFSRSSTMSIRNDGRAMVNKGFCEVHWSIEADIADGHLIYVTGDPDTLGCWKPEMAVVLSPSTEHTNLWKIQIQVPCGIHFKYNYFIKEKGQSFCNIVWRPGPEISISVPLISSGKHMIVVRDSWMKTIIQRPPILSWGSWMIETELPDCHIKHGDYQTSLSVG